ncbi:MAG: phosphatase PAP2 family protein [Byssovorax sp.]
MYVPAAVQALDERLLVSLRSTPSSIVTAFFVLTVIGGGWGLLAFLPFLARRDTRRATLVLLGAITLTSALVSLLKELTGRVRPSDALAWCTPLAGSSPGGPSFPSGHAAGIFTFATFIALRAPRYGLPALILAVLIAASRCVLGVHYPSDVLAGALLGTTVGAGFARWTTPRTLTDQHNQQYRDRKGADRAGIT